MNRVIDQIPKDRNKIIQARIALTDGLLSQLYGNRYLCREKLMNIIYLCENHFNLTGVKGVYYRTLSGPANFHMLEEIEQKLNIVGWEQSNDNSSSIIGYYKSAKAGEKKQKTFDLDSLWNEKACDIRKFARLMKPMNYEDMMMIATVYAAWNDLILSGLPFTDNDILRDVLDNWKMSYHQISKFNWRKTLAWLRSAQIMPRGYGHKTIPINHN